jgi:FtsH-binding integral membrane protein
MAYDPLNSQSQAAGYAAGSVIDAGLQSFMQGVYRTMCWGLGVTGATAYAVSNTPVLSNLLVHSGFSTIVMLGTFIFLFVGFRPGRIAQASASSLRTTFLLFSVLMGLLLSIVFEVYTGTSIARAFFITAAAFAGTCLYGYTARRDLTSMGSFMVMGLLGIVIAGLVNMFLHSAMVYFVTSVMGVVIFTGLTAWETQKLKYLYNAGDTEGNGKQAVLGALNLYMNFINLFQIIVGFTGDRR